MEFFYFTGNFEVRSLFDIYVIQHSKANQAFKYKAQGIGMSGYFDRVMAVSASRLKCGDAARVNGIPVESACFREAIYTRRHAGTN